MGLKTTLYIGPYRPPSHQVEPQSGPDPRKASGESRSSPSVATSAAEHVSRPEPTGGIDVGAHPNGGEQGVDHLGVVRRTGNKGVEDRVRRGTECHVLTHDAPRIEQERPDVAVGDLSSVGHMLRTPAGVIVEHGVRGQPVQSHRGPKPVDAG